MTNSEPKALPSSAERDATPQPPRRNGSTTRTPQKKSTATPKLSFAFFAVCLICLIGLILVVYRSDGRSVGTWIPRLPAVQPSVLISLLVTLFNTFEFFILADGLNIAWWRAFQDGATLQTLHYLKWNGLKETWRALKVGFDTQRLFAVLAVASVIRIYDAPLLQRSIKSVPSDQAVAYPNTWTLPHEIPEGWAGTVDRAAPAGLFATTDFDRVLKQWYTYADIETVDICDGTCTGPVSGAGVTIECSSTDYVIDLREVSQNPQSLFQVDFNRGADDAGLPVMDMRLLYAKETDSQCRAMMTSQLCNVRLASVMYDMYQQNASFFLDTAKYPRALEIQPVHANASSVNGTPADILAALEYFGYYFFQSNATVSRPDTPGGEFSWEPSGVPSRQYANFLSSEDAYNNSCAFRWDNATDDLIWGLHEVMFRMAYASASGNETGPALTWTYTGSGLVYKAEYLAFWIAIGSMIVGLLASMSLLWGYWHLKREVSLSPVEMARALAETVLLPPSGSHDMTVEQLLKEFGDRKAKQTVTAGVV